MKTRTWISVVAILALFILGISLWQYITSQNDKLEAMCKNSANAAREYFEKFDANGKESDYIAGVAEFRTYMTAYLCLVDGVSDTNYIWCNILYGDMILNSEKVKTHIFDLVGALEYLAEDYDHPNGFNLINALNNQLNAE